MPQSGGSRLAASSSPRTLARQNQLNTTLHRTSQQDLQSSLHAIPRPATTMTAEPLGWLASLILLSTLGRQVWRQAHAPTVEGVSKWLFIGQMTASLLYLIYSVLVGNMVFIASNAALLVTGIVGQVIYFRRKRRERAGVSIPPAY